MELIGVYKTLDLNCRPSDLIGINDLYTAYCFDEVCAIIISKLAQGETPFVGSKPDGLNHVSKPSDLYKKYGR